ncbi:arginase [Syncephalastrum racemosum]|uniref:Arginase n=1 Tax=Syncephalastrum racemosum TaxID=13706 RepID=A0A1X2H2D1_SYNRA|nr:arginase [Syncephalastrum racemosum]
MLRLLRSLSLLALFVCTASATPVLYHNQKLRQQTQAFVDGVLPGVPSGFTGIGTFAHLPYEKCFQNNSTEFDIAFLGAPFDIGTSYRPGARFGPMGIREASRRIDGYNVPQGVDPFRDWARIVDCGDVELTPYDIEYAVKQMQASHQHLLHSTPAHTGRFPRILTLGGDHTITLPILRSIHSAYGPVSVIHFDSHLDSWKPGQLGMPGVTHGTYFYYAAQEGLLQKGASIHAGIRTPLTSIKDYEDDYEVGFDIIEARDIDVIGTQGIIDRIRAAVGDNYVYLSIDIDTLDPAFAPATGTPETGGWTSRELRQIIRGLEGLNLVGADLVEVAPAYDTNAQITALAAADILYEVLSLMVRKPLN